MKTAAFSYLISKIPTIKPATMQTPNTTQLTHSAVGYAPIAPNINSYIYLMINKWINLTSRIRAVPNNPAKNIVHLKNQYPIKIKKSPIIIPTPAT